MFTITVFLFIIVCVCVLVADQDCLQLLMERDVVHTVVKVMDSLPSHSAAQEVCLVVRTHT